MWDRCVGNKEIQFRRKNKTFAERNFYLRQLNVLCPTFLISKKKHSYLSYIYQLLTFELKCHLDNPARSAAYMQVVTSLENVIATIFNFKIMVIVRLISNHLHHLIINLEFLVPLGKSRQKRVIGGREVGKRYCYHFSTSTCIFLQYSNIFNSNISI